MANFPKTISVLLLLAAVQANAQDRKFSFGPRLDLVAGGGTDPYLTGPQQSGSFYSEVYPAMEMRSSGERDVITASYAFGLHRTISGSTFNSNSHVASASFSTALSPTWKFNVSDSVQMTSDFFTFNTTRGETTATDSFRLLFSPVSTNRGTRTNTATIGTEYRLGADSTLALSASHSLRDYSDSAAYQGILSNQQRFSETATYSQRITPRGTWNVGYTGAINTFKDFDTVRSHAVSAGYSYQIGRDLMLQVSGGPSYIQTSQSSNDYTGYNAAASLHKIIKTKNALSAYYNYFTGDSSGLGSVSDTRSAGFGWTELVGQSLTAFADVSAFDARSRLGNIYNVRGVSAAASFGIPLTRELSLNGGAQYSRYDQTSLFGFNQKRIFISLRYNAPDLWKFSR
jgi:hypothetical protein